jgi:hypothetical protein
MTPARNGRQPWPRVSVYCRCGAQWHGIHARNNPVIDYHERQCGAPIDEQTYILVTRRAPRKPWKEPEP